MTNWLHSKILNTKRSGLTKIKLQNWTQTSLYGRKANICVWQDHFEFMKSNEMLNVHSYTQKLQHVYNSFVENRPAIWSFSQWQQAQNNKKKLIGFVCSTPAAIIQVALNQAIISFIDRCKTHWWRELKWKPNSRTAWWIATSHCKS